MVRLSIVLRTLCRPIQLLYPLEIRDEDDGATDDGPNDNTNYAGPDIQGTRTTTERSEGTTSSHTEDVTNQGDSFTITVCDDSHPSDGQQSQRTTALEAKDHLKVMALQDEDKTTTLLPCGQRGGAC